MDPSDFLVKIWYQGSKTKEVALLQNGVRNTPVLF